MDVEVPLVIPVLGAMAATAGSWYLFCKSLKEPIYVGFRARFALMGYAHGLKRSEAKNAIRDVKVESSYLATLAMGGKSVIRRAARERREYLNSLENIN